MPPSLSPSPGASQAPAPTRSAASRPQVSATAAPSASPHAVTGSATRSAAPPYRSVVVLDDRTGDQGLQGPSYGDLLRVEVADDGHDARVTVVLAGTLPVRAAARESIGVGVDFFSSATQRSSDYQLFADGEPDGWFAYLDTPRGFVRYPGTFAVGGTRIVFTVPWSALGGRSRGYVSAFADWTQGGQAATLGGNAASNDRAPAIGSTAYAR